VTAKLKPAQSPLGLSPVAAFATGTGINAAFFAFGVFTAQASLWFALLPACWIAVGSINFGRALYAARHR
jgi:hypothetical protein